MSYELHYHDMSYTTLKQAAILSKFEATAVQGHQADVAGSALHPALLGVLWTLFASNTP